MRLGSRKAPGHLGGGGQNVGPGTAVRPCQQAQAARQQGHMFQAIVGSSVRACLKPEKGW